ncbi:MAG: hypothetical protein JWR58_1236, partial [Pseudonocardia sp.]|nr:hypothetical protein [Pseudonocardia sp.]
GRLTDRGRGRWLLVGGLLAGAGAMICNSRGTQLGHGLLLLGAFVAFEHRVQDPLLDLRRLRTQPYSLR